MRQPGVHLRSSGAAARGCIVRLLPSKPRTASSNDNPPGKRRSSRSAASGDARFCRSSASEPERRRAAGQAAPRQARLIRHGIPYESELRRSELFERTLSNPSSHRLTCVHSLSEQAFPRVCSPAKSARPALTSPVQIERKLHGFERRSNALVGNTASGCRGAVPCGGGTAFQSGKCDKGVPVSAPAASSGPFRGVLLAGSADVWDDYALLKLKRFLEFGDRLFHVLLPQKEVRHDLMIVDELILWSFNGREDIKRFVDHLQPIVEFTEIELEHGVMRILLKGLLVYADDFARLTLL